MVNEVATQYLNAAETTESKQNKDIVRVAEAGMDVRHEAIARPARKSARWPSDSPSKYLGLQAPTRRSTQRSPLAELETG